MPHHLPQTGVIYWFRNDLRLHDPIALRQAIDFAELHQTWLLPVYIYDTALNEPSPWGFPRLGEHRRVWIQQSVAGLAHKITGLGSQLLQIEGKPAEILAALSAFLGYCVVFCEEIATPFEQMQVTALKRAGVEIQTHWQSTLMSIEDLPLPPHKLPDQFTKFRQLLEKPSFKAAPPASSIEHLPPLPPAGQLSTLRDRFPNITANETPYKADPRSSFPSWQAAHESGERAALQHLQRYCDRLLPSTYKLTRNGLQGMDYSTKWSPWLATGALSARTAWQRIQMFKAQHGANESTYWIGFELLWRDHFRWLHLKHGHHLYKRLGLWPTLKQAIEHTEQKFNSWRLAQTGQPFVDAGMRELNATGYVSNRMRQNLASFLIHDLSCDWRAGAAWFEAQLIDYDVYSNQGNWLYLSGQGTDPRGSRRFNPDKQASDYDSDWAYRRLWSA